MKCPRCGSEVPQGYAFCGRCGSSLFAANQQNYTQNFVNPQQQYNYQQYVQPKKQHGKGFYNLIGALIVLVLIGGFFGYVKIKTFIYDSKPSLLDYEVKTGEVLSGSGTNIGTYGYIDISKPRLERTSQEDYKKFCFLYNRTFPVEPGDEACQAIATLKSSLPADEGRAGKEMSSLAAKLLLGAERDKESFEKASAEFLDNGDLAENLLEFINTLQV